MLVCKFWFLTYIMVKIVLAGNSNMCFFEICNYLFLRQRSRRTLKQKDDPNSRPQSAGRPPSSDGKTPKSSVSSLRNEAKEAKYKKEVEDISTGEWFFARKRCSLKNFGTVQFIQKPKFLMLWTKI